MNWKAHHLMMHTDLQRSTSVWQHRVISTNNYHVVHILISFFLTVLNFLMLPSLKSLLQVCHLNQGYCVSLYSANVLPNPFYNLYICLLIHNLSSNQPYALVMKSVQIGHCDTPSALPACTMTPHRSLVVMERILLSK